MNLYKNIFTGIFLLILGGWLACGGNDSGRLSQEKAALQEKTRETLEEIEDIIKGLHEQRNEAENAGLEARVAYLQEEIAELENYRSALNLKLQQIESISAAEWDRFDVETDGILIEARAALNEMEIQSEDWPGEPGTR